MKIKKTILLYFLASGMFAVAEPVQATTARNDDANGLVSAKPLNAKMLTKYLDPLPPLAKIQGYKDEGRGKEGSLENPLAISVTEIPLQVLPSDFKAGPFAGKTLLWVYNGTYPGPTLEVRRGIPLEIYYDNQLQKPELERYLPIDQTLDWANPFNLPPSRKPYFGPMPIVTHLHGGEVESASDGGPDAWYTPGFEKTGVDFITRIHHYPNAQEATTLWYHDHVMGLNRLSIYAGLAGFYFIRDPQKEISNLPQGKYEQALMLQDRQFDTNGQLYLPHEGDVPNIHPFWNGHTMGDVIVVNGKAWPYLNVEPRRYRFRILNASNSRFFDLSFSNGLGFWQIGTDGGYLDKPVPIKKILLSNAERADIVVDFSGLKAGTIFLLKNSAKSPFPDGDKPDEFTSAQVMQFRIIPLTAPDTSFNPANSSSLRLETTSVLRPKNPLVRLDKLMAVATKVRHLTLNSLEAEPDKDISYMLNNAHAMDNATEDPRIGTTEVWEIINVTDDAHPIHLHLTQFQILSRQEFDWKKYKSDYEKSFPGGTFKPFFGPPRPADPKFPGGNPDVQPYLRGSPRAPEPNEAGWKDTYISNNAEVSRIIVRWMPTYIPLQDSRFTAGKNFYPFSPYLPKNFIDPLTSRRTGPGYFWHCHMLEHENNEMMRPYHLTQ